VRNGDGVRVETEGLTKCLRFFFFCRTKRFVCLEVGWGGGEGEGEVATRGKTLEPNSSYFF
jgi:hypothetical protein